jgi:hypothetical protein
MYGFISCTLYMSVGYATILRIITGEPIAHTSAQNSIDPQTMNNTTDSYELSIMDLLCSILTCAFSIALLFFSIFHFHLVLTGQTTIEVKQQHSKHHTLNHNTSSSTSTRRVWSAKQHPASRRDNFCAVFGDNPLYWFLPVNSCDEFGGYAFDFQFAGEDESEDESDIEAGLASGTARSAVYKAIGGAAQVSTHNVNPISAIATISAQKLHSHSQSQHEASHHPISSTQMTNNDLDVLLATSPNRSADSESINHTSMTSPQHLNHSHTQLASRSPSKQ